MVNRDVPVVSLVTGAASGIGRATALRLAQRGDQVVLVDRNHDGLTATATAIRAAGGEALVAVADVTDRAAIRRVVADAEALGPVSYALSNAGVASRAPVHQMTLHDWAVVVETHLTGTFHVCQAVLAQMVQRRQGAIVVTCSDFSVIGMPGAANYAAAKTALYSLTKSLALEFAPHIRVNAVGPGPIDTPLLHVGRTQAEWEALASSYAARLPMRRLGDPDEVASVVEFLLSDRSAYITGQLLQPNGGQVMW